MGQGVIVYDSGHSTVTGMPDYAKDVANRSADIVLATSDVIEAAGADYQLMGIADEVTTNYWLAMPGINTVRVIGPTFHHSAAVVIPMYKTLIMDEVECRPDTANTKMWELQPGGRLIGGRSYCVLPTSYYNTDCLTIHGIFVSYGDRVCEATRLEHQFIMGYPPRDTTASAAIALICDGSVTPDCFLTALKLGPIEIKGGWQYGIRKFVKAEPLTNPVLHWQPYINANEIKDLTITECVYPFYNAMDDTNQANGYIAIMGNKHKARIQAGAAGAVHEVIKHVDVAGLTAEQGEIYEGYLFDWSAAHGDVLDLVFGTHNTIHLDCPTCDWIGLKLYSTGTYYEERGDGLTNILIDNWHFMTQKACDREPKVVTVAEKAVALQIMYKFNATTWKIATNAAALTAYNELVLLPYAIGGGTFTNGTGVAFGSPITLALGANVINITGAGSFTVVVNQKATITVAAGMTVDYAAIYPGTTVINVTGVGNLTITPISQGTGIREGYCYNAGWAAAFYGDGVALDVTKPIYLGTLGRLTQVVPAGGAGTVVRIVASPITTSAIRFFGNELAYGEI